MLSLPGLPAYTLYRPTGNRWRGGSAFGFPLVATPLSGQTRANNGAPASTESVSGSSLPVIMKFSGSMQGFGGAILPGLRVMTFAPYKDQTGGVPLWTETKNVLVDGDGRFTVSLRSNSTNGIPASTFASAEPRWVSLTLDDGADRPRLELSSVLYTFRASDADALRG